MMVMLSDNKGGDGVVTYHTSNMLSQSNEKDDDYSISMLLMITDDDQDHCR